MSARPRLVEEGTPIPEASAAAAAVEAAVVRNAHHSNNHHHGTVAGDEHMYETSIGSSQQQARLDASHGHLHPPLHHQNNHHRHGHQLHHGSRHYEGHGHGAVKTHITIGGGGGGSSTISSSSHLRQPRQPQQPQQTNHYCQGSADSEMQATSASPSHRTSSLSAAAGPVANAGARSKHNRNRPTTQLHTHLTIGGGSSIDGGERHGRQGGSNHHDNHTGIHTGNMQQRQHQAGGTAHSSPGKYPHRLVIGGYTGHVSVAMPLPHDYMTAERNVGVGRQDFLPQHATNAAVVIPAPPASGQSELAPDEYDYDLLGGGVPDHHFDQQSDSNALGDAGLSYADTSTNAADVAERMEVEDIIPLPPLIVIDGANVAYAYGKAKSVGNSAVISSHSTDHSGHSSGGNISTYSRQGSSFGRSFQPDAKGILIACNYFMNAGCRVQVVLPAQWLQTKSQRRNDVGGGSYHSGYESPALVSEMTPQLEVLHGLREQGLLCAAPANDDDDSYAILLARREDARAARRRGGGQARAKSGDGKPISIIEEGGGFVLSNDQFRDAQSRDRTSSAPTGLGGWLEGKKKKGISRLQDRINNIPGRMSYGFGDIGSIDQYGDKELDLIPNPRHPLVEEVEQGNRARELSLA